MKILVVGAGGFTGGFIVEEGLRRHFEMFAGVRESTSRKFLQDDSIHFVTLDFENPESLASSLEEALPEGEKWDYIIYNLGATKALSFSDFSKINHDYLSYFINALKESDKVPRKFLYISSLSAMGPGDEKNYTPFHEKRVPMPNTKYGASKLKAEMLLASSGIPYIILRPTGIYGPRDKDYYLMFKSMAKGFDFSVGYKKQLLTFIYVEDLARAIYDALEKAPVGETYIIAEPRAYTQAEFRDIARKELGKSFIIPVKMPLGAVKAVSALAEKWGVARMKPSTLNRDKFNIMKQRNWSADVSKAQKDFGFSPKVSLEEGVKKSVDWYKKEGWL